MTTKWTETATQEAPNGQLVMTMDSGGNEQIRIRRGKMFFVADDSMYLYYTPLRWRALTPAEIAREKAEQEAQVGRDCRDRLRRIEDRFATKEAP